MAQQRSTTWRSSAAQRGAARGTVAQHHTEHKAAQKRAYRHGGVVSCLAQLQGNL
jgi:hypothetical protein